VLSAELAKIDALSLLRKYGGLLATMTTSSLMVACTGTVTVTDDPDEVCEVAVAAVAPTIVTPVQDGLHQPGALVQIEASQPSTTSDKPRIVEFEVWAMVDGDPIAKVWGASQPDASDTPTLDLSEGDFEPGTQELAAWRDYGVRARTRDGGVLCEFGEWSDYQDFKIDDGSEAIFDDQIIRDVEITLEQESFDLINAEALPPGCVPYHRPYHPGTVTFDGVVYENAGVRTKGGCGSSRDLSGKASFKINLSDYSVPDTCPMTRRASGLKRITVNNHYQDSSFIHERLAYHFYDMVGVPVPRRAPIRVHVNDEHWGLYLHLESIDRRFFQRRYKGVAAEGMAYEGTYFCDLVPGNLPPVDGPETCFGVKFSADCSTPDPGGDPYNYEPLISFVGQLDALPVDGFYPAVRDIVDFDAFLSQWAVESIINHWDGGIFDVLNNYRVYHDPASNKWVMIPTGMDQSFNGGQRPIDPWAPNSIIARRCLLEKPCEDAFAARLKEVLTLFEAEDFATMANTIRTQIAAEVALEPRSDPSNFDARVDTTIDFINGRAATVNAWLADHGY
jgi:hypothetical protein